MSFLPGLVLNLKGPLTIWMMRHLSNTSPPCHTEEDFTFCRVTEGMVLEFLGKMQSKYSQGPNGISTKLLKAIIPHILKPLTHCFNLSFQSAFVAPQFCSACVIPVYKSGKRDNYYNYRPISLLSSMCRPAEGVFK